MVLLTVSVVVRVLCERSEPRFWHENCPSLRRASWGVVLSYWGSVLGLGPALIHSGKFCLPCNALRFLLSLIRGGAMGTSCPLV